ncbi:hypothetical protein [Ruminococcus sp. HUN007]|uniref:hypothetical protein n=1 Tax=Ruminococcus sp. HUN007 TaxID=1514668 RepID=UPI0012DE2D3A|nr:hypothetical protein [Ruminococcus sp. HUN007]
MNKYRITAGVAALLMGMASPAAFFDADTVSCEKVYDVRLSAETVEIDINDIPENREVLVGINIDNNPGFIGMAFWIEKDSRLSCDDIRPFELNGLFGFNHCFFGSGNVLETSIIPNCYSDNGELYSGNGQLFRFILKLPSDLNPGDFFEIKPLIRYDGDGRMNQAYFGRENSFDSVFKVDNFAEPVSGGIRITGQKNEPEPSKEPEPEPSPSPSPEQKPSEQPSANNNDQPSSGNNSENKQETQAVTAATSESVTSESVSESTSVSETSGVTTVSESSAVTTSVSETEVTDETAAVSETTVTEPVTEENKGKGSKLPFAIGGIAVILAGAAAYAAGRKNKKNKEN